MRIIVSSGPSDLSLEMIHACFQTTSYFHFAPVEVLKSKSQQVCTRLWQTWKHTGCLSSHLNTVRNVELKQSVDYLSTNHLGIFFCCSLWNVTISCVWNWTYLGFSLLIRWKKVRGENRVRIESENNLSHYCLNQLFNIQSYYTLLLKARWSSSFSHSTAWNQNYCNWNDWNC